MKFVIARLKEPSTWASIAGALIAVHVNIDPGLFQHIADVGIAAAGLAGFLLPEQSA